MEAPYCYFAYVKCGLVSALYTHPILGWCHVLDCANLPRPERYEEENLIMVGIIPGPSEPSLSVNSFLSPLVQELSQAWHTGLRVKTSPTTEITVRLALTCVACDLPASRKVCGFLGHNSTYGCNKCYKRFPSCVGSMDYSGFNRDTWVL